MCFRMVNLHDRGTRWLMIGVQHNDLLTGGKFHVRKLPVFSAGLLRTYEQSVHKQGLILAAFEKASATLLQRDRLASIGAGPDH
jgi:hypothetical protein